MAPAHWQGMRAAAVRLLRAQRRLQAADTLEATPFELLDAHNGFGDEFNVLYRHPPIDVYVKLGIVVRSAS